MTVFSRPLGMWPARARAVGVRYRCDPNTGDAAPPEFPAPPSVSRWWTVRRTPACRPEYRNRRSRHAKSEAAEAVSRLRSEIDSCHGRATLTLQKFGAM